MMSSILQVNRILENLLPDATGKKLVLLTGARQTGKTTLLKMKYPRLRYVNLDAFENRVFVNSVSTFDWGKTVGRAVLDEAQKEPAVFEKTKYAFDAGELDFTVLSGSSQILLLKRIRETLAGRITLFELMPLLLAEAAGRTDPAGVLLARMLSGEEVSGVLETAASRLIPEEDAVLRKAEDRMLAHGGMPALLNLGEAEKWQWLKDYEYTYLERDLADLARLSDLEPFRKFQKLSALRSGNLLVYSELARDCGVSPDTARRYLEYLSLSYQVFLLQPYHENLTSAVIKAPKLYWLDTGIMRSLSGQKEAVTGAIYETYVMAELWKWIRTFRADCQLSFYRTRSGMEIDGLLQTAAGFIGLEVKAGETVAPRDTAALAAVAEKLGNRWLGGLVVYRGDEIRLVAKPGIYAVPSRRLFG